MIGRALLTLGLAAAFCGPASAQEGDPFLSGTLKTIQQRGTIRIGYRENAVPLSFLNGAKQPVGFSIELCRGIAQDVANRLNRELVDADAPSWRTGLRLSFEAVTADARLPKIMSGDIDLECGSTTATTERQKSVAFSPIFFMAGTKLMVPVLAGGGSAASSYRDLAGKKIAVSAGTTTTVAIQRLAATTSPPIQVVETGSLDAAYAALTSGGADAFASDDILLYGFAASKPEGRKFRVVGEYLSFEPYAVVLRKDDPAFADLVRQSFQRMARENVLNAAYHRWFGDALPNGETLNLPLSPQLTEIYRALGQPD